MTYEAVESLCALHGSKKLNGTLERCAFCLRLPTVVCLINGNGVFSCTVDIIERWMQNDCKLLMVL